MRNLLPLILLCFSLNLKAQHTVKGQVLDSSTKETLAFATIQCDHASTISNENGVFLLKPAKAIHWVVVRYMGYRADTIPVKENTGNLLIYVEQMPSVLNELVVSAREDNEPYKLFASAMKSFRKTSAETSDTKAFFRSYTTVDDVNPAELFEAYYNLKCNAFEVRDIKLKAGRFLLPKQTAFMNMNSLSLIALFKPFSENNAAFFPYTPFKMTTWKHLKRNYAIAILDKTPVENDTLFHFRFTARDPVNSFSGELYCYWKQQKVEKIILKADKATQTPFVSIADSVQNKCTNLTYNIELGFDAFQQKTLLNYVVFNIRFDMSNPTGSKKINTGMKLYLYDYGKSFQLPVLRSNTNKTDYQLITYLPYNEYFFTRNPVIAESNVERNLRTVFASMPCYDSRLKNDSIPFLPNRIEAWSRDWKPNPYLIGSKPIGDSHARIKHYKYESKKAEWDSSFVSTMLYLDYDCYPDTIVFNTTALIDYKYSYAIKLDDITIGYLRMYLDMAKISADKMLWEARKKYSSVCPTSEEFVKLYDKYNGAYELDIYNLYCNSNSKLKYPVYGSLKKVITRNLEYAESMVK